MPVKYSTFVFDRSLLFQHKIPICPSGFYSLLQKRVHCWAFECHNSIPIFVQFPFHIDCGYLSKILWIDSFAIAESKVGEWRWTDGWWCRREEKSYVGHREQKKVVYWELSHYSFWLLCLCQKWWSYWGNMWVVQVLIATSSIQYSQNSHTHTHTHRSFKSHMQTFLWSSLLRSIWQYTQKK